MKDIAQKYFQAWNTNNAESLRPLLASKVVLQDWEVTKEGIEEVIAANQSIFDNVPGIKIEVKDIAVSETQALCEIDVVINANESLSVVDVITIENNLITAVKAFKK